MISRSLKDKSIKIRERLHDWMNLNRQGQEGDMFHATDPRVRELLQRTAGVLKPGAGQEEAMAFAEALRVVERALSAPSCPCQTDTARETRRKDGIEAAELQGILMRGHEACRPRDAGLMGWAAAALSAPPAAGVPEVEELKRLAALVPPLPWHVDKFNQGSETFSKVLGGAPSFKPAYLEPVHVLITQNELGWPLADFIAAAVNAVHALIAAPTPPASEQQRAAVMPDNLETHRSSWRGMFLELIERTSDSVERSYYQHELRALDAMYADVDRLRLSPHLTKGEEA